MLQPDSFATMAAPNGTQICEIGGVGTFVYGEPWLPHDWHPAANATIYLLLLAWTFVGVAILADLFMATIEEITSTKKTVLIMVDGKERMYRIAVWNATVANLTLMVRRPPSPRRARMGALLWRSRRTVVPLGPQARASGALCCYCGRFPPKPPPPKPGKCFVA